MELTRTTWDSRPRLSGRAQLGVGGPQDKIATGRKPMAIAVEIQRRSKLRLYKLRFCYAAFSLACATLKIVHSSK